MTNKYDTPHVGEYSPITNVDIKNAQIKQEAREFILEEIKGLSEQTKRKIRQALNIIQH